MLIAKYMLFESGISCNLVGRCGVAGIAHSLSDL